MNIWQISWFIKLLGSTRVSINSPFQWNYIKKRMTRLLYLVQIPDKYWPIENKCSNYFEFPMMSLVYHLWTGLQVFCLEAQCASSHHSFSFYIFYYYNIIIIESSDLSMHVICFNYKTWINRVLLKMNIFKP